MVILTAFVGGSGFIVGCGVTWTGETVGAFAGGSVGETVGLGP